MAGPGFQGQWSSYVPNTQASGDLIVGFSRNAADFPVNNYIQMFPSEKMFGLYASWTSRNAARIIGTASQEHLWSDGDARPPGLGNTESWQFLGYKTQRYAYSFTLGELTYQQASMDLILANSRDMAQQCMTARTLLVQNTLQGASWGSNTSAVNGGLLPAGQTWANGVTDVAAGVGPNILTCLQAGEIAIHQATIGVVKPSMLTLVVNPVLAQAMSRSAEIRNYLKQSPFAMAQVRMDEPSMNGKWGLPDTLYGVNIVVEDAVRVTTKKNTANTAALSYVMPNNMAFLLARQGVLEGIGGTRSYSTVQCFFYKDEMTVETFYDSVNRRTLGSVVTNYVPVLATPYSGYQFTACI